MPNAARVAMVREGPVAVLALDHPPGNRLTQSMLQDLFSLVNGLGKAADILVVVVTAKGGRAFCEGLDEVEWAAFSPKEVSLLRTLAQQAALGIQRARLVSDLRDKIDQLERAQQQLVQKERLERELELARQVQQSMLPRSFPHLPGFHFVARNEPARQVGGDFYEVIRLDEDRFGVAIADVSDKALPAALYMALTRSLLRAEAPRQPSPQAVLSNINRLLLELGDGNSFVTLFYAVVDGNSRRMVYSRAGHDRPLLLR